MAEDADVVGDLLTQMGRAYSRLSGRPSFLSTELPAWVYAGLPFGEVTAEVAREMLRRVEARLRALDN